MNINVEQYHLQQAEVKNQKKDGRKEGRKENFIVFSQFIVNRS
jgi:hypothetical protein